MSRILLKIDIPEDCKWINAEITSSNKDDSERWVHDLHYNEDEIKRLIEVYEKIKDKIQDRIEKKD